jgi:hypothetical protein
LSQPRGVLWLRDNGRVGWRREKSGGNRIDRDAGRAEVSGQRPCEGDEAPLGGHIDGIACSRDQRCNRRDVDNAPLAPLDHEPRGFSGHMERRDEIDIDEATDRCHVEFEQPTPIAYPHVVDENVKPPVLCADAVERLANGRFIGNVEQAGDGGPASRSDHGHRPLWPFRTAPIGEHQRTRRGERRGDFQPEPPPCARHQSDFSL